MALDSMEPLDREVLALRHFEQLSRAEIAQVLGVSEAAAGKRYLRALERFKQVLAESPGRTGRPAAMSDAAIRIRSARRSGRGVPRRVPSRRATIADRICQRTS